MAATPFHSHPNRCRLSKPTLRSLRHHSNCRRSNPYSTNPNRSRTLMARWKLTEPHYLSVPTERWEHTTTDSRTGKPVRKMYRVPKHLDPRLEDDWTHRPENNNMDGEIIVCWEGKGLSRDIIFEGNPTPGMLPLDAEAEEISGKFSWTPTQGIDEDSQRQSFYARLGDTLIDQMTELKVARETAPSNPGLDKFMETMMAMMAQNQQILAALAGKVQP